MTTISLTEPILRKASAYSYLSHKTHAFAQAKINCPIIMKLATAAIASHIILLVSPGSLVLACSDKEASPSTLRTHIRKTQDIKTSSSKKRRRFLVIPGFLPSRAANPGKGSILTKGQLGKNVVIKVAFTQAGVRFGDSGRNNKYAPRNSKANHARFDPKIHGIAVDEDEPLDDSAVPSSKPTISATTIAVALAAYHRVHMPLIEDERPRRREIMDMIGRRRRSPTTSNSRDDPRLSRRLLKPNRLTGNSIDGRDAIEGST